MKRISIIVLIIIWATTFNNIAAAEQQNEYRKYYAVIYNRVLRVSPFLGHEWADWTANRILYHCEQYRVDPLLVAAIAQQESGFSMYEPTPYGWIVKRSRDQNGTFVGAIGIMQLMPETAAILGVDPEDPEQNIEGGIRYLAEQLWRYRNTGEWQATLAAAAYNAGPEAVNRFNGVPPYDETVQYVIRVGEIYNSFLAELG